MTLALARPARSRRRGWFGVWALSGVALAGCTRAASDASTVSTTVQSPGPAVTSPIDGSADPASPPTDRVAGASATTLAEPGQDDTAQTNAAQSDTAQDDTAQDDTAQDDTARQACVASLSVDLKVRQTLMPAVYGDDLDAAADLVASESVGGVILMTWPPGSNAAALQRLKTAGRVPVLLAVDEEGGSVQRLRSLGTLPGQKTVAGTMTATEAEELVATHGESVRGLGIDVVFGPVADVGDAAPIGDRSFGDDPATVSRYVAAYVRGWNRVGIMPVVKHFPGHGHASADTHLAEASTPPLSELWKSDLVPYDESGIVGSTGVMVGHLLVPGLTDAEELPASLSPSAMSLLRDRLGFGDSLVFTDSLSMDAISDRFSLGDAGVKALVAGADVLVYNDAAQTAAAVDRIGSAVASGELPEARLDDAVGRILGAKNVDPCSLVA